MRNILGLDLGSSSIGWAVIHEDDAHDELVAMGSRIVQLSPDELSSFTQGNGVSVNAQRTQARGQRRGMTATSCGGHCWWRSCVSWICCPMLL